MADDKILASIRDLDAGLCDLIALLKNPISFGSLKQIIALVGVLKLLVADGQAALPQLSTLDLAESGEILAGSYQAFQDVVAALAK